MCLHILACLFPPLAVCFKNGVGCDCCINILLTLLGYLPGCLHACYIVSQDESSRINQTVIVQQQTTHVGGAQPQPYPYPVVQAQPYPGGGYPHPGMQQAQPAYYPVGAYPQAGMQSPQPYPAGAYPHAGMQSHGYPGTSPPSAPPPYTAVSIN